MKRLVAPTLFLMLLSTLTGCMTTRNANVVGNTFPQRETFTRKSVAILPVKSQTSLTTDSHTPLKKALNKQIGIAVKSKVPESAVVDAQSSLDTLNEAGKLDILEKLLTGYENTGAFDRKLLQSLCAALKSDYVLLPKLKIEQMDAVIAKTFISSLELFLLNKNGGDPVWDGIGDFKRYGMYGFGGTETDEAAKELVKLAFGGSE